MDQRLDGIRSDLTHRIAALGAASARARVRPQQLASDLDQLRRIAQAAGLFPAVTVAHALEAALARGERGPLIHGWLDILRDAVGSEAATPDACDTYLAACSVRYG